MMFRVLISISLMTNFASGAKEEVIPRPPTTCTEARLKHLGFSVQRSSGAKEFSFPENICAMSGDKFLKNQGNFHLIIPNSASNEEIAEKLYSFATSYEAFCAFQNQMRPGMRKAFERIFNNKNYKFDPHGDTQLPESWTSQQSSSPRGRPSEAVTDLYTKPVQVECALGKQLFQVAYGRELLGPFFDEIFSSSEPRYISVDPFYRTTPWSAPHDRYGAVGKEIDRIRESFESHALFKSNHSAIGAPGIIFSLINDSQLLDSKADVNENFVVVDISKEAYEDYKENYEARSDEASRYDYPRAYDFPLKVWEKHRRTLEVSGLTSEVAASVREATGHRAFLRGTVVYVHPLGLMTLEEHILRLMKINPRMPYVIRLESGYPLYVPADDEQLGNGPMNLFFHYI